MPTELKAPLLAVLIDAENASAKIAEALFKEIATIGEAAARRIYGDFSSPQMRGWTEVLARLRYKRSRISRTRKERTLATSLL